MAMITLSVILGWELNHMDVITAFLNGKLKGRIYMNNHLGLLYQTEVVAMRIKLVNWIDRFMAWNSFLDSGTRKLTII